MPDFGYHIWEKSKDFRVWRMLERVGRRQQADDPPVSTPGHFLTRSGATEYGRRNLRERTIQVRACAWPNCASQHLDEFLELQPEEVVEAVKERKVEENRLSRQRRRVKDVKRKAEFEEAVEREVAARLVLTWWQPTETPGRLYKVAGGPEGTHSCTSSTASAPPRLPPCPRRRRCRVRNGLLRIVDRVGLGLWCPTP